MSIQVVMDKGSAMVDRARDEAGVVRLRETVEKRLAALVVLLEGWADWQRSYRMRLGFPSRAMTGGGAGVTTFEDLCNEADSAMFEAIDAAVDDLPPLERAAVLRRYGIAAVFRFPRENYAEQLDRAHDALIRALPRRGVDIG